MQTDSVDHVGSEGAVVQAVRAGRPYALINFHTGRYQTEGNIFVAVGGCARTNWCCTGVTSVPVHQTIGIQETSGIDPQTIKCCLIVEYRGEQDTIALSFGDSARCIGTAHYAASST